jgi:predicted transcriptional regulator
MAADGSPLPIGAGEYYFNPKARTKRMMQSQLSTEARRVYACLELATMGFRQELAVILEDRRQRPLTPTDIAAQTGMAKQNVRRALAELEAEGLAARVAAGGTGQNLSRGNVHIYSWAVPRSASATEDRPAEEERYFPDWLPESLIPVAKRLRIKFSPGDASARDYFSPELAERLEVAARDYFEAEKEVTRLLKGVCASPPLYKEDRKERNTEERKEESVSPSVVEYREPEEPRPTDGPTLYTEPAEPEPIGDVAPLIAAVQQYHSIDLTTKDAVDMVEHCREEQRDPAISPAEVARFVSTVDPIRSNSTIKHPRRFLRTAVARKITRQDLAVLRNHSTPRVPVACDSAFDDPEVESIRCHRCGGLTIHYLSGRVSPCPCGSGPPGRIQ